MKIQTFKRLTPEDADPKDRDLVNKIANSVNPFADDLQRLFNKNITVTDNLNMQWVYVTVVVNDSGYPKNPSTLQFKSTLTGKCLGISIEKVDNLTNSTGYLTSAPFMQWTETSGIITINHFNGLTTNNKYFITLLEKV